MSATTLPTAEQSQRAKWDLLLLDIETRTEQLRHMKSYNPIEMEHRIEQLRQIKTYEPRKLVLSGITTGAAVFGSGAAFLGLLLHWMGKL